LSNPRSLVLALYEHWDLVAWLVRLSREQPVFEPEQILSVSTKLAPALGLAGHEATLRKLLNADLLENLPREQTLRLNPYVLEFVRGLTHEHELGLSSVLMARVEAIREATFRLNEGLQQRDFSLLRQSALKLAELFRQICQQLEQDRHAILDLAERAKSADSQMPISRRYREVLEAYGQYVGPMTDMIDSGPSGSFYRLLEEAEHALDHAVDALTVQGALYTQRIGIRAVAFQAKELRRVGREVLNQCNSTLLPLREEVREHNNLSSAISQLLGQVRKRGLRRSLRQADLPLWRREQGRRVSVGDEVLTIMGEARQFQPKTRAFPEEAAGDADAVIDRIDEAELRHRLLADAPVLNLLDWLYRHYGQVGDASLLRLYQDLVNDPAWQATQAAQRGQTDLNTIRVTLFPHAIHKP